MSRLLPLSVIFFSFTALVLMPTSGPRIESSGNQYGPHAEPSGGQEYGPHAEPGGESQYGPHAEPNGGVSLF